MPFHFGTPELIILLVIVLLIFGVGRIGRIAGELGQGLRQFRQGLTPDEPAPSAPDKDQK